jgi:formyl-CoA transferase/succinyl-CoA--D-citramalate CoA-transferase
VRGRTGSVLPGVAPSNAYPCLDGADVVIAANADSVFVRLCAAIGAPELAEDPRFSTHGARGANTLELDALLSAWTSTRTVDEVVDVLERAGVPVGRIYTAADMVQDAHFLARDMVLRRRTTDGLELPMTGVVPKFSRTPGHVLSTGPRLGEHTDQVLQDLAAIDDAERARLRAAGVI